MEINTCLAPEITEYFDCKLLGRRSLKLGDNLDKLWNCYVYIKEKLMHKSRYNAQWEKKCKILEKEILELYERTKKKEENLKAEERPKAKGPFYHVEIPEECLDTVFDGLRNRGCYYTSKKFNNNEI